MLTPEWKRWIAASRLLRVPDHEIIEILKKQGIDEREVTAELQILAEHPYFHAARTHSEILQKRWSLGIIQRSLYQLNKEHSQIERRSNVSRQEFLEKYYSANRPVILCGLMNEWKAMARWTPDYLKAVCGTEVVDVMTGRESNPRYEMDAARHTRQMPFSQYVDMVESGGNNNDYYLVARNDFFRSAATRRLLADVQIFPEYLRTDTPGDGMYLWYGPAGTVTPLHHDEMNIFMAQLQGSKHIRLISPMELDSIYNHEGVYGAVDCERPDYEKFPKFRDATVIEFDLMPEEVLFLPVGWWHHVRALEKSITVTFTNFLFPNAFEWQHPARYPV